MNIIKKGLTSFQLKIIALIIMTVDHFGAYRLLTQSPDINVYMRIIGRIAAPVFLFLIVEGIRHTRSRTKYIARLYMAAAATELLRVFFEIDMGNIFQTFFYAALYIICFDIMANAEAVTRRSLGAAAVTALPVLFHLLPSHPVLRAFFPSLLNVEFSVIFVMLAVAWYFINNKTINCVLFAGLALTLRFFNLFGGPLQWYMVLAVPFLFLYNGQKGRGGLKYFFYVYYPAHQILFFLISNL